jgi:hypothetical protein
MEITRYGRVWRGPSWTALGRSSLSNESMGFSSNLGPDKELWREMSLIDANSSDSRKKLDVSGSRRMKPVPNWSFGKSHRFSV